jgi:subtilisin family serine protease
LTKSVLAVKADAARRLFELSCSQLAWAILDSGIDARHPAFRKRDAKGKPYAQAFESARSGDRPARSNQPVNRTRVQATYDFTRVRDLLNPDLDEAEANIERLEAELRTADPAFSQGIREELAFWKKLVEQDPRAREQTARELRERLLSGRTIQWSDVEELIRIPHDEDYPVPQHDHGTHVAGILGADWRPDDTFDDDGRTTDERVSGMCPDIQLYDFRVLDQDGEGDEFAVMAALQFVRYLNANRDVPLIHGVNLSIAILHDVANYACGRTPVCDECERVVASGVVVVAAAGNEGYIQYTTPSGPTDGYRSISITDPANAEAVISVGATHRYYPHTYGVSYFSSRGPTGDGRVKPDLVAPGEKILSPVPGGVQIKDGTSMAAPHVSGAAALLMSRYRELIGQPQVIKKVLCATATDLGRERYFQGAGMLDVLRALQHL